MLVRQRRHRRQQRSGGAGGAGAAADCTVGVSWNNYQQPRWAATDKPNIQKAVEAAGGKYIDERREPQHRAAADRRRHPDLAGRQGPGPARAGHDGDRPALQKAKDAGIPVIAYDRLIEDPSVLYITFDNVGVGKAEAEAILAKVPKGNYVLIKGDPGDPNASTFLPQGWDEAGLKDKVDSGDIKILNGPDGTFTDAWKTEKAQANMEAIIDKAVADGTKIDAVLAENDSTALGVAAALEAKSYGFPPLSGQDGDPANLNNVALGKQYVDVWKNSQRAGQGGRPGCARALQRTRTSARSRSTSTRRSRRRPATPADFTTPGGKTVKSIILKPTPITADKLDQVDRRRLVCHQGPDLQGRHGRRSGRRCVQVTVSDR